MRGDIDLYCVNVILCPLCESENKTFTIITDRGEKQRISFLSLFHFIDKKISLQPPTSLQLKTNGIENISREIFFFNVEDFYKILTLF